MVFHGNTLRMHNGLLSIEDTLRKFNFIFFTKHILFCLSALLLTYLFFRDNNELSHALGVSYL